MSEAGDGTDAAAEVPAADLAPVIELLKSDDDAARIDGATKLKEIASEPRNDDAVFAAELSPHLLNMLASDDEPTNVAALRALHALVSRPGPILRLRVGTPETMDALWSKLVPSTSGWYEPTEEEMSRAAEMDEPPPTPGPLLVTPPSTKIAFHALRVICAAVFADWQSVEHLMGAPEGAMALVRDLSPLLNLLKPEGTTSVAVLQKATRLVHLLCRTSFGRKSLLEQGLRATLVDAFNAPPPRDSKQVISCCQIVLAAVSDPDDTPLELIEGGVIDPLAPLLIDEDVDVQTAACGALTRLAAMSPEAAARMFELDVLGDIRRMLPKPDRLSTPPDTPESLDVDNVFRELFHDDGDDGDGDGDAGTTAALSERPSLNALTLTTPTMRPDLGPPPKPPVPLARTEKLAAGLLELLAALLSHDAIRDDACRVGGDVEAARGLLPSGKHRPTWTTTIAHQFLPAATYERPATPTPPEEEAGAAAEGGAEGGEEGGGEGGEDAAAAAAAEETPTPSAAEGGEEEKPGPAADGEAKRDDDGGGAADAEVYDADANDDKKSFDTWDWEPVVVPGDPPWDDHLVCEAALRALEICARHPRCRAQLNEDDGAGVKQLCEVLKREMRGCVEPTLRIMLLLMAHARQEREEGGGGCGGEEEEEEEAASSVGEGEEAEDGAKPKPKAKPFDVLADADVKATLNGVGTGDPGSAAYDQLRLTKALSLVAYPLEEVLPDRRPRPPTPDPPPPPPKVPLLVGHMKGTLRVAVGAHKQLEEAAIRAKEGAGEEVGPEGGGEGGGGEGEGDAAPGEDVLEIVTEK